MRLVIAISALLLTTTAAHAADCGQRGRGDILKVTDWKAVMKEGSIGPYPSVTIQFTNESGKEIRMAKASVWFFDALGDSISGVAIDKDIRLKPAGTQEQTFAMSGSVDFERLTKLEKRDAEGLICLEAVVYEDGTKEEFK
jgi:hypothetical protein